MLAPQIAVGIAGVVFRGGHFHSHPSRYIFLARRFVSNVDTLTRRALDCFIDALGQTWTGTPQALAIELQGHKNSPASQPGRGLIHSDAADNRAVPLLPGASLWTTTQKPQGGFPFLTAFDDSIITWFFGFFMQAFFTNWLHKYLLKSFLEWHPMTQLLFLHRICRHQLFPQELQPKQYLAQSCHVMFSF